MSCQCTCGAIGLLSPIILMLLQSSNDERFEAVGDSGELGEDGGVRDTVVLYISEIESFDGMLSIDTFFYLLVKLIRDLVDGADHDVDNDLEWESKVVLRIACIFRSRGSVFYSHGD